MGVFSLYYTPAQGRPREAEHWTVDGSADGRSVVCLFTKMEALARIRELYDAQIGRLEVELSTLRKERRRLPRPTSQEEGEP